MKIELDPARYASPGLRATVLHRDKFRCRYCQCKVTNDTANVDHVVAWKHGGATNLRNLVASCRPCNKSKGNANWKPRSIGYRRRKQSTRINAPKGTRPESWVGMEPHEPTSYDLRVLNGIELKRKQKNLRRAKVKRKSGLGQ